MFRACELKDQTYKKTRTLGFSEFVEELGWSPRTRILESLFSDLNCFEVLGFLWGQEPRGPKDQKNSTFRARLKISSEDELERKELGP